MPRIGDSVILNDFSKTGKVVFTYYQNSIKHQRCHVVDEDGVEHLNLLSAKLKKLGGSTMTHEELTNLTAPELNTALGNKYTPSQLRHKKKSELVEEVLKKTKPASKSAGTKINRAEAQEALTETLKEKYPKAEVKATSDYIAVKSEGRENIFIRAKANGEFKFEQPITVSGEDALFKLLDSRLS